MLKRLRLRLSFLLLISIFQLPIIITQLSANEVMNTSLRLQDITVKKGMVTTIKFSSLVKYFVIGDELIVDVNNINPNVIMLSPKLANETTNMNVYTSNGTYVFVIKTLDYNNPQNPTLHINIGDLAYTPYQKRLDKKIKKEMPEDNPNFDYNFDMEARTFCHWWFCHDKTIAPRKVWTDGKYTYLDYNTKDGIVDRNISLVAEVVDDYDAPVDSFIKDGVIVVHTLAKTLTIKASKKFVCIKYKGGKYEID
ncbi:TrbG/VirB9/CagX family protein [Candidatus Hepatincola sp. Av]